MHQYDIVFLGGGLGSSTVSRYLKRKHPWLRILVLEKKTHASWSPGESTVGVAGLFLVRDLGLSTYAYLNHLPKNGLRFFFTNANAPFDINRCSEIGSSSLIPTFQIDRKRIVEDLWQLNEKDGVSTKLGCAITSLRLSAGTGEPHRLEFTQNGIGQNLEARWVINGSGRSSEFAPIFNELSEATPDAEHRTAAAWGRFTNVADLDQLGGEEWRAKVGFTNRYLATTHLMGEGYWIWHIPIGRGVVSFGVVYDTDVVKEDLTVGENFRAFLFRHPVTAPLLKDARQEDFQSHPHLAYKRKNYCSVDRWAFVGESFMFVDPFYSPGSDVISREARLLEHLVLSGPADLPGAVDLANSSMDLEYQMLKELYVGQYRGFGSFEAFEIKSFWDFYAYTNRTVWPFLEKYQESKEWLRRQVEDGRASLGLIRALQGGFRELARFRKSEGGLERKNLAHYSGRQMLFRSEKEMLEGRYSDLLSAQNHFALCRLSILELIEARFGLKGLAGRKIVHDALSPAVMAEFALSEEWLAGFRSLLAAQLNQALARRTGLQAAFTVTKESFSGELSEVRGEARPDLIEAARNIWNEPAVPPVF